MGKNQSDYNIYGKRIRFRLKLHCPEKNKTSCLCIHNQLHFEAKQHLLNVSNKLFQMTIVAKP